MGLTGSVMYVSLATNFEVLINLLKVYTNKY